MRITTIALTAFALGGCNSLLGITDITVGSGSADAASGKCFNAPNDGALFMGCPTAPTGQLTIQANIDTDNDPNCVKIGQGAAAPIACMIAADSIVVPTGHHFVSGGNVLVLVAATTIDVQGTLDASGSPTTTPVTGSVCNSVSSGSVAASGTAGGGGGGAFGDTSGTGGAGGTVNAQGGNGASGISSIIVVRAGCPGAPGGALDPFGTTSLGGIPGGAIYMIAGTSVTVEASGVVLADGGGGGGALANEGGGGGASGGLIGFDSLVVDIEGTVSAVGGGGGGGGGDNSGDNGGNAMGMPHGVGSIPGGNGGDGEDDFTSPGDGVTATGMGGGGGAGGSFGVVWIHSPAASLGAATIDPTPVQN